MFYRTIRSLLARWQDRGVELDEAQAQKLGAVPADHRVVYLLRNHHLIDTALIQNSLDKKDVLQQRATIIGFHLGFFATVLHVLRKLFLFRRENPYERLRRCLDENRPVFLGLNFTDETIATRLSCVRSRKLLNSVLNYATEHQVTVALIPLFVIWGPRPQRLQPSLLDLVLGSADRPRLLRKLAKLVLRGSQRLIHVGDPMTLDPDRAATTSLFQLAEEVGRAITLEKRVIQGPPLLGAEDALRTLIKDRYVLRYMGRTCGKDRNKLRTMRRAGRSILREIASDISYRYVEWAAYVLDLVWNKIYDGIAVSAADLEKLRSFFKRGPVVLVPSHKSHTDYLLISYLLYKNNIIVPHIAAGINMAFFPMGYLFRRMGAFFLRRSFKDDEFYKLLLERYVAFLLSHGFPQEFFIEGTRSRTGKLEKPKMGYLGMVLKSILKGACKEVQFVPISIVYEKIVEESSYLKEGSGLEKKGEKTSDLFKLRKVLNKTYGRVYLNIGEAVSTADFIPSTISPAARRAIGHDQLLQYNYLLANRIVSEIIRSIPVTATFLFALIVLNRPRRGMDLTRIRLIAGELMRLVARRGISCSEELEDVNKGLGLAGETLASQGKLERYPFLEQVVYQVRGPRERAGLTYYKNIIIYHFLHHALAATIFRRYFAEEVPPMHGRLDVPTFLAHFESLVLLFKHEFSFPEQQRVADAGQAVLDDLFALGWVGRDAEDCLEIIDYRMIKFLHKVMVPAYETLLTMVDYFHQVEDVEPCQERNLVNAIMEFGRFQFARGAVQFEEAFSGINVRNALPYFVFKGLLVLEPGERKGKTYTLQPSATVLQDICLDCALIRDADPRDSHHVLPPRRRMPPTLAMEVPHACPPLS